MPAGATDRSAEQATLLLIFTGWSWKSYTGIAPAALVAIDSQVFFPGDVSKGFRFELKADPGAHTLTVMLGANARTIPIVVEAGGTYEYNLKFGGRWGALKIEPPDGGPSTEDAG